MSTFKRRDSSAILIFVYLLINVSRRSEKNIGENVTFLNALERYVGKSGNDYLICQLFPA